VDQFGIVLHHFYPLDHGALKGSDAMLRAVLERVLVSTNAVRSIYAVPVLCNFSGEAPSGDYGGGGDPSSSTHVWAFDVHTRERVLRDLESDKRNKSGRKYTDLGFCPLPPRPTAVATKAKEKGEKRDDDDDQEEEEDNDDADDAGAGVAGAAADSGTATHSIIPFFYMGAQPGRKWSSQHDNGGHTGNDSAPEREDSVYLAHAFVVAMRPWPELIALTLAPYLPQALASIVAGYAPLA
jgi:hypothetical protein